MANWKKIIVSGSGAHLASVTASNLTATNILSAGTNGLISNSGLTLTGGVLTGNSTSLVFNGADSVITGSFTGSFAGVHTGDGSGLTGIALDIDNLGATNVSETSVVDADLFVFSDGGTEKKITYAQLYGNLFGEISGDVTISSAGASTIGAGTVEGTMLATNVADGGTIEVSSNNLSVLKVPNALSFSNGIASTGDFDGSSAIGISVNSGSLLPFYSGSTFDQVSGDITITSAGVATIGANTIDGSQLEDSITIAQDLTVTGDLVVNGSTTTVNTTNLLVEDKFILLNSGSASAPAEGGIIVSEGSGTGTALFYETDNTIDRWGFNVAVAHDATTANTTAYVSQVVDENNANHQGASSGSYEKNGNIKVGTDGSIYIYA